MNKYLLLLINNKKNNKYLKLIKKMEKEIILVTGATDGISKKEVKMLEKEGHKVIIQGRNPEKLKKL